MFDMTELLKKAKESSLKRTDEERRQILIDAKILTEEGVYHPNYFSEETVEKSRKALEEQKFKACKDEAEKINEIINTEPSGYEKTKRL